MIVGVKENILLYYKEIENDPYHRYRSWEHCYSFFQKCHSSEDDASVDTATLHLAFYLASRGMYRGSSRSLQKDYRVHMPIVAEILDDKYSALWSMDFDTIDTTGPEVNLVFQLVSTVKRIYGRLQISPTNTLVTKVLLGTFGCTPAYDALFIEGVTYWNQTLPQEYRPKFPARFGKHNYRGLIDLYRGRKNEFQEAQTYIEQRSITYPVMKLADMYFWMLGYQQSESGKARR